MTLSKETIMYYTNPVGQLHTPEDWDNRLVYVTQTMRRNDTRNTLGSIVRVTGTLRDSGRLWYRTERGDYVVGLPYNWYANTRNGDRMIAVVSDDLYAILPAVRVLTGRRGVRGDITAWSDRKDHPMTGGRFFNTLLAAPWAQELWPMREDSDEVAAKKVEVAKLRWEQAHKKLAILHEGARRDWLDDLKEIREAGHRFPVPSFDAEVGGNILIPVSRKPTERDIEKLQARLKGNGSKVELDRAYMQPYVAQTFSKTLSLNMTMEEMATQGKDRITRLVQDEFQDYNLRVDVTYQNNVLSGAKNI